VLTPLLQLSTHGARWAPSVGLGFGVPVEVRPTARVGGRLLVDMFVHGFGIAASVDYFPSVRDEAGDAVRLTFLAQASF
jgi:hypothetical protein